jgi:hypothetical protein
MKIITQHYEDKFEPNLENTIFKLDDEFSKIQELIYNKKQFLFNKQQNLYNISKNNEFLENIKEDYTKYYEYIIQQKNEQIKALQVLNEYVNDLTEFGKLTEFNIEDAKQEQEKIKKEIDDIKLNLDDIINKVKL